MAAPPTTSPLVAFAKAAWERWKRFGRRVADVQAWIILLLVYFVVSLPFALGARLVRGRFGAVPSAASGFWTPRARTEHTLEAVARQY